MNLAKLLRLIALAAAVLAFTAVNAAASTDFINGYGWVTSESLIQSTGATHTSLNSTSCHGGSACTFGNADVTFTTTGVSFTNEGSPTPTVAQWLGSSAFPLDSLVDNVPSSLMDPTIWEFTGHISVSNGETFTFRHDDGVTFVVDGVTVINQPGATAPTLSSGTYTGASDGNATFDLVYDECCSPPAVLQVGLLGPQNAPVPEPGSIALFGTGLAAVAGVIRRRLAR